MWIEIKRKVIKTQYWHWVGKQAPSYMGDTVNWWPCLLAVDQPVLQCKTCIPFDPVVSLLVIPFRDLWRGLLDTEFVIVQREMEYEHPLIPGALSHQYACIVESWSYSSLYLLSGRVSIIQFWVKIAYYRKAMYLMGRLGIESMSFYSGLCTHPCFDSLEWSFQNHQNLIRGYPWMIDLRFFWLSFIFLYIYLIVCLYMLKVSIYPL